LFVKNVDPGNTGFEKLEDQNKAWRAPALRPKKFRHAQKVDFSQNITI